MRFALCPCCHRHVRPSDAQCPFCGTSQKRGSSAPLILALAVGAGALVACESADLPAVAGKVDSGTEAALGGGAGAGNGGNAGTSGGSGGDAGTSGGSGGSSEAGLGGAYGPPPDAATGGSAGAEGGLGGSAGAYGPPPDSGWGGQGGTEAGAGGSDSGLGGTDSGPGGTGGEAPDATDDATDGEGIDVILPEAGTGGVYGPPPQ